MKGAAGIRELWSAEASGQALHPVDGTIVASGERWQGVAAFDAETGRRAWRYPCAAHPLGIHGPHVLVRASRHEIHLLDAGSGRPEGCIPHPYFHHAIAEGGVVFTHRHPAWGEEALVSAVDLASGRRLWMHVGALERGPGEPRPAFAASGGTVVAGENGALLALDAATGLVRWRRYWPEWEEPDGDGRRPPKTGPVLIRGGRVVAAVGSHAVCLAGEDGRSLWEAEGLVHTADDALVYASGHDRYRVRALADGAERGKSAAGGAPKPLQALLMAESRVGRVDERHAYLLAGWSEGQALIAVDRETGKYLWHHQPAGGHHASAPVLAHGRLFYINGNRLYALAPPG
jgi:outer membrane protein assembly factor BamB